MIPKNWDAESDDYFGLSNSIKTDGIGIKIIEINKETAEELLLVLSHTYIPHEFIKVHQLIKRCWEFSEK